MAETTTPHAGSSTPLVEIPTPAITATGKKIAISKQFSTSSNDISLPITGELSGYRLIDCAEVMDNLDKDGQCPYCHAKLTLTEDFSCRRDLVSDLKVVCMNSECEYKIVLSNPYSSMAKSLNRRSILAMRSIGRGHSSMMTFFGLMDMLPP